MALGLICIDKNQRDRNSAKCPIGASDGLKVVSIVGAACPHQNWVLWVACLARLEQKDRNRARENARGKLDSCSPLPSKVPAPTTVSHPTIAR